MKIIKSIVFLTVLFCGIHGCSTVNYRTSYFENNPKQSEALNIAKASGFKRLKDVEVTKEEAISKGLLGPDSVSNAKAGGIALVAGTTGIQAIGGILSGADLAFGGLFLVTAIFKQKDQENMNWVFGWTPKEDISTGSETAYIAEIASKTFLSIQESLESKKVETKLIDTYIGLEKINGRYVVNDQCDESSMVSSLCLLGIGHYEKGFRELNQEWFGGIIESDIPSFKDFKSGYFWRNGLVDTFGKNGLEISTLDIWINVSKSLPKEAYIYLAPNNYSIDIGEGLIRNGSVPLLLNKGEIMMFMKVTEK